MTRFTLFAALALVPGLATPALAQNLPNTLTASIESPAAISTSATALPDAPSTVMTSSVAAPTAMQDGQTPAVGVKGVKGKYNTLILPGQTAQPLHGAEYLIYGLNDSFNLYQLVGVTASATYSHLVDSQPHFGSNSEAFGKRVGAAALRNTVQTLATDSLFSPMFHDDPRYYEMGDGQSFLKRVGYAASRVLVTRSNSGKARLNAPLLLGYGAAAGTNNLYYPDQDRGGANTAKNFGTSLVGAALGFEVNEFLDDALHIVHIRKN